MSSHPHFQTISAVGKGTPSQAVKKIKNQRQLNMFSTRPLVLYLPSLPIPLFYYILYPNVGLITP
jgi:hypothetical protein